MRHDAHLWIRPDAARWLKPGTDPADVYPTLARQREAANAAALEAEVAAGYRLLAVLREEVAELREELKRRRALEAKYSPSQPRVPAGNPRGGQWSNRNEGGADFGGFGSGDGAEGGSSSDGSGGESEGVDASDVSSGTDSENFSDSIVKIAADNSGRRYSPDLVEEEAHVGHTLREHTEKTGDELLASTTPDRGDTGIYSYARKRNGSFESREAANDLVNRTLEQNRDQVDAVASGQSADAFVTARFGYKTGREAFRSDIDAKPYLRDTYGVGVYIVHDPRRERGYSVITAYPRNEQPR
jgi:hypothetical protein